MYSYRSSAPHLGSIFAVEVEVVQRSASHVGPAETLPIERYRPGAMAMKQTRLLDKL
jgi:hypothetical protein